MQAKKTIPRVRRVYSDVAGKTAADIVAAECAALASVL